MEAREKEDKDFFICARIDALQTLGVDEMLARAKAAAELGVDMLLPHGIQAIRPKNGNNIKDIIKDLYKKMGAPKTWIWGSGPEEFTAKDYEDVDAKMWVPGNPLPGVAKTLIEMYKGLYDTGSTKSFFPNGMPDNAYLNKLRRLDFWQELEKNMLRQGTSNPLDTATQRNEFLGTVKKLSNRNHRKSRMLALGL